MTMAAWPPTGIDWYYTDEYVAIACADALDLVPQLSGVTAVVTDPPYELGFMGKSWDSRGVSFRAETWVAIRTACLPGAPLLAFGGDRTHHRQMVAIEDAGWQIRTCLYWVFGSGFPKSLDIGKAIDKSKGAEREITGKYRGVTQGDGGRYNWHNTDKTGATYVDITTPATREAQLWDGYGTALKPAAEIICLAMNPLDGTFANNALKHGVAGLNVDGGRVPLNGEKLSFEHTDTTGAVRRGYPKGSGERHGADREDVVATERRGTWENTKGRWPSNLLHDGSEEVLRLFPETGKSGIAVRRHGNKSKGLFSVSIAVGSEDVGFGDSGSAARFFYTAKASKRERGEGNNWPTVKPLALMKYLLTLVRMPQHNLILDPFMGSGTTLLACAELGIRCIGIDSDENACRIATNRLKAERVMELGI